MAAGSFNHHGMQYSTTMSNDPDIHEEFRPTNKLESSGLSLKDIVEQDVKDNPEYNVHLSAKNILEDPELKNAVKAYRNWPTFPQIFIRGEFIGGSDIILNMHQDCKNSRLTEEESIHPLVAISGVLTYNDNMMIMFLVVTSTFAMAMVPFARTATTMTMMYPMMTVMSSMVTTTAATMPVITRTMLMNMMSPAMTVVLVNKISPAVTVIPSTVTSYTSVMSTGAVVSQVVNTMTEWMMVMSTGAVVSQVVNTVTEWMMMFAAPRHLCC
ncbi:unnamed protein product [Camellia sinensis]